MNSLSKKLNKASQSTWDTFFAAAQTAGITLPDDTSFSATLKEVLTFSDFVAGNFIRNPALLQDLLKNGDLEKKYNNDEYENKLKNALSDPAVAKDEAGLSHILRSIRRREMIRIAWRDLTGLADLTETMIDLSALADACIDKALSLLHEWQCTTFGTPFNPSGEPLHLVVFGMGKLGGRELNFSSDVDLIFVFPHAGETKGGPKSISNDQFFTRLARRLINIIGETTAEGLVFRVDMRLRPFGDSGPMVMSFDAMEDYYQNQGREWERYAWIKARAIAGDKKAGTELLARLNPFVFRKYLDFGVFDGLRDMKQKISLEVKRKGMQDNIKLGPGGIREIEFFGQMFQLIRGGVMPVLQEPRIMKVLQTLAQEKYISAEIRDELLDAYKFLRNTEHRLQEYSDQQTHDIPSDLIGRERLSASMKFSDWPSFASQLQLHMKIVHKHFNNLLGAKESTGSQDHEKAELIKLSTLWKALEKHEDAAEILLSAGFDEPGDIINILGSLRNDPHTRALSNEGRTRLNRLIPLVLQKAGLSEHPEIVLDRIIELIKTIERRTTYLALLFENPTALDHLVKLADAGPWIISFLACHPVLLDELLDPRTLYSPPKKSNIEREIQKKLDQVDPDDLEAQIIELSIFKQVNTLRIAAADVTGAVPLMRVSDYLTETAETVLDKVLELSWNHLVAKHGRPACILEGKKCDKGFVIIAYGKLGGIELGYGSDLDLVFIHAGAEGQTKGGSHPIDNSHFFSRLGQRIIHTLTAPTPAGILYQADMRLRPDGSSGILTATIQSFKEYQEEKAWAWEHQAIIRARAICGDPLLMDSFEKIRQNILALPREKNALKEKVSTMRNRMRQELIKPEKGVFDIKQGKGGLVDIEFLVQYLVLLNSNKYAELTKWSDKVRILQTLTEVGIIDEDTGYFLKEAYLTYRTEIHRLTLKEKPTKVSEKKFSHLRKKVAEIWEDLIEPLD